MRPMEPILHQETRNNQKKLDKRFNTILNELRVQGITHTDEAQRIQFINALRRDDWNDNRKTLKTLPIHNEKQ